MIELFLVDHIKMVDDLIKYILCFLNRYTYTYNVYNDRIITRRNLNDLRNTFRP